MLRLKFGIKNIDYNNIAVLFMPYLEQWLSEQDNLFYSAISKVISKGGRPTAFSDRFLSLIPAKDNLVMLMFSRNKAECIKALQNVMAKNGIDARITYMNADSVERDGKCQLRIVLDLEEIDYAAVIGRFLPGIMQKLTEKEKQGGKLAGLLKGRQELALQAIRAALGVIQLTQLDELSADILMQYKAEVKEALNILLHNNNINADIYQFKAESILR